MEMLLEKWARFVAAGRWPLLIIAVWIILVAVALKFGPAINTVAAMQNNTSSLPASAPSVQADHIYTTKFAAGQATVQKETDVLVFTDPRGISAQDIALAEQIETWLLAPGTHPAQLLSVAGPGPLSGSTTILRDGRQRGGSHALAQCRSLLAGGATGGRRGLYDCNTGATQYVPWRSPGAGGRSKLDGP